MCYINNEMDLREITDRYIQELEKQVPSERETPSLLGRIKKFLFDNHCAKDHREKWSYLHNGITVMYESSICFRLNKLLSYLKLMHNNANRALVINALKHNLRAENKRISRPEYSMNFRFWEVDLAESKSL